MDATLTGVEHLTEDTAPLLAAALARAARFSGDKTYPTITLHLRPREKTGWLEFILMIHQEGASRPFTIGCIQRSQGSDFEFHS